LGAPLRLSRLPLAAILLVAAVPALARGQSAADSARTRVDSAKAPAGADTAKRPSLFGPQTDLGIQMNGRLESRLERTKNERCVSTQFLNIASQCSATFQPAFDFQFNVKTGGTVAERMHVNVDYDSKREFDASNSISLYYEGRKADWLQKVEVGNVSFEVPSSRFITSGIPQGNYGVQAIARFGNVRLRAIAAQQKGNVVRDRVFNVGARTQQRVEREVEDYQVESRRFFFTVDPRGFAGYPNVDILNATRMRQLLAALPDSLRPTRVSLYRLLIGGQPPNPNGPQFRLIGDANSRRGQIYETLRENVDYYVDPSQLWVVLARPLNLNNERLVVAWTVRLNGRDTTIASTGGTPDVEFTSREQFASLLWDPQVRPGDPASFLEMRSVYRVGGDDVRRETVGVTIVTGATGAQEKPPAGSARTFLELFGLSQPVNPSAFDVDNRLWPRPGDPIAAIGGTASLRVIRDQFVVLPSLHPFGRDGLAQPAGIPSNDAIYLTPGEYLYSPQHPPSVFVIRMTYESDGGGDGGTLALGTVQVRPFSERITLENGTALKRDADYRVDYDIGLVSFLHADTLFRAPRNVTVRFEENPLFATSPTSILGIASTVPLKYGDLNFIAISQRQTSTFTRPPLGYEQQSALIAGVNGAFDFNAPALARLAGRLPGADAKAPARVRIDAEFATSRPQPNGAGQAFVESFEGEGGAAVPLADPNWYLSSQPALGSRLAGRIGGATTLDLARAATFAWQNNGNDPAGKPVSFTLQQIDPLTNIVGAGLQQPEQVLWLTLYPLSIGGAYSDRAKKYEWLVSNAPAGRRWRSVRQPLGPSGTDLSRVENVEFWALVDTAGARRKRNPAVVLDFGDVSENTVATGPTQLTVQPASGGADTLFTGRAVYGRDTLQSERDPFSRAFNQEKNDVGLPGDLIPRLPFTSPAGSSVLTNYAMCSRGNQRLALVGDTKTNCTVNNGRLDEWDLDGDNVLNFDSSRREAEKLFRYAVDLGDPKSWTRVGGCQTSPIDSLGPSGNRLCWVLVRVPFGAPLDTVNGGPSVQRVRALRLTMVSGEALGDDEFTRVPIARLRLVGAPWLKRSDRTIAGIAGARTGAGTVRASPIGTQDADSLNGLGYQSPPGVTDQADKVLSGLESQRIVINERSMRITATQLGRFERAEAYFRFPEGPKNFMQYRELRIWARGRGDGWGPNGELQFFVKLGRDADNFYAYRTPANAGAGQSAWLDVRVDFARLYALRTRLQNSYLQNRPDSLACTGADSALIARSGVPIGQITRRYAACADGYIVYTVDPAVSPPNLAGVHELAAGIVRVDSLLGGATRLLPGDTAEVWVDDIRLANLVNTPGYAGQVGFDLTAGDVGALRLNLTHRDPNFRQLSEVPSYVSGDNIDLSSTVRLDKFLPKAFGYTMPVTVMHSTTANTPLFVSRSDIRGDGVEGLRTPKIDATNVSLSIRRATPVEPGWAAPIVNHLSATATYNTARSSSEFQTGASSLFTAGLDYVVGGDLEKMPMPAWWDRAFGALPAWLGGAEFVQAMRGAQWHVRPAALRLSANYAKGDDRRSSFLKPAHSLTDSARTVSGLTSYWRNATALELRPFDAMNARVELSSLRDLRHFGDSTPVTAAATSERSMLLGLDAGLERERTLSTTFALSPQLRGWLRPRFDFSSGFALQRDPNTRQLLREQDTAGVFRLPRRLNALQVINAGAAIDFAKLARAWIPDSSVVRRVEGTLLPLDVNYSRTLTSAFDGTPFTPGFGYQWGWSGTSDFLRDHGRFATTAGSVAQVTLASGLRLPWGITLAARTQRVATRNWLRRFDDSRAVIDGEQVTLPDLTLRATFRPRLLERFVTSIGTNARLVETRQRSTAPSGVFGLTDDVRTSRVLSYPLGASIQWNDRGALSTSFNFASTFRFDSLPGTVLDSRSQDFGADVARKFRLPAEWKARSDLRARMGYQQTATSAFVQGGLKGSARSRLAENGRRAFTMNADTDVAENLTFSLQGAHIVTFDNNLNRRFTQIVLTAVLQISFYAGELR
jgi:cell surface protein SprA